MADDTKTPDADPKDTSAEGATETPSPDASVEPVAQEVAAAAKPISVPPPLPSDYEMPDDYASQDTIGQLKDWVVANPGLAVVGAAGVGLLVGRLVTALFPDPDPPSLADRVEERARQLQKEAKRHGTKARGEIASFASDAGDTLQEKLHHAADALKDAADTAGDAAEDGYEKTKDLAETIADAAKVAVTGVLASKIDDWVGKVRD
ncbi:MAG: hypothetical protein AAGK21_02210 [Bacteroidota bacterium]